MIQDIEPQYSGKEIIVAKYIFDYEADSLKGWEICCYGFQAGKYLLYKQIEIPKKYKDASSALSEELGFKPLLLQDTAAR